MSIICTDITTYRRLDRRIKHSYTDTFPSLAINDLKCSGNYIYHLDFKLSPCFICNVFSFGYLPGVWVLIADVSEHSISFIFIGRSIYFIDLSMKMEPIECSETSAISTQTPGRYSKENITYIPPALILKNPYVLHNLLVYFHIFWE